MKRNALATQSASAVAKAAFGTALQGEERERGEGTGGWLVAGSAVCKCSRGRWQNRIMAGLLFALLLFALWSNKHVYVDTPN